MTAADQAADLRSAVRAGVTVWFPLVGSIGAWAVHLVALAALARYTCTRPEREWVLHAITAGCLAVAVVALALALRLARAGGSDDEAADAEGRRAFLGRLAAVVCAANILLIAVEEVYVVVFHGVGCG